MTSTLAGIEAIDRGVDVAILRDANGFIAEGQSHNVMCIRDGKLYTPLESQALAGTGRAAVMRAAQELGVEVIETNLTAYDLICADEAFVVNSSLPVAGLASIDNRSLPAPLPGPLTVRLREAFVAEAFAEGVPVPQPAAVTI
jgi:branched-subunit amino acid aminotransferase/4-amino-4-deoxychorismate lyase